MYHQPHLSLAAEIILMQFLKEMFLNFIGAENFFHENPEH